MDKNYAYNKFKALVPEEVTRKIPSEREHHALFNLLLLLEKQHPEELQRGLSDQAQADERAALQALIKSSFASVMAEHFKQGLVTDADQPQVVKRDVAATDPEANKQITALVKPEYLKRIPVFIRKHAMGKTCQLLAREFPDLYNEFKGEPSQDAVDKMRTLINLIFEERIAKHHM